ncbi:MAG: DUF2093 domain-containing protein [Rhizobiaceae bacterium]
MNRFERGGSGEARVRFMDHDFQVISPGSHVICVITSQIIPLDELKYWSVARQEPYADAAASLARELETNAELRARR